MEENTGAPLRSVSEAWRDETGEEALKGIENTTETGEPTAPAPPDEATLLKQELEAAKAEAAKNLDGWQRSAADLANYKRRVEREKDQMYQNAAASLIERLLPVLDDFDRAMKAPLLDWEGIHLIHRKLQSIVENEGVTRLEADGAMFDPNFHEAVTHDASENHTEGQIIEVLRQGYRMGDRVLRAALVRVAK